MFTQKLAEVFAHSLQDKPLRFRIVETCFAGRFPLRLRNLDRDECREAFPKVRTNEFRPLIVRRQILAKRYREGPQKPRNVRAA